MSNTTTDSPMTSNECREKPHRRGLQYTLLDLLVGTVLAAVVLGCAAWETQIGATVSLAAVGVLLFVLAIVHRRVGLAGLACLCWLLSGYVYFLVPMSVKEEICTICGKVQRTETLGKAFEKISERDTELSQWYSRAGLRRHQHCWIFFWSSERNSHGQWSHADSFGWRLNPLRYLRNAQKKLEKTAFDKLANEFFGTHADDEQCRQFCQKCQSLGLGSDL